MDGGTSGPRLVWTPRCRLCHLCEDGGDLRYWALVGYTPRGLQVVQCSGWRQRCGLDRVDDCSHRRQQGLDPGEQRADSFHVTREPRHEAHEPLDLFTPERARCESNDCRLAVRTASSRPSLQPQAIQASSSWAKQALTVLTQVHSFLSFQG